MAKVTEKYKYRYRKLETIFLEIGIFLQEIFKDNFYSNGTLLAIRMRIAVQCIY